VSEGQSQENQFQTEIGRMPDEAIESASLQSLPGARRYVRAEGSAEGSDCYDTNSQTENQDPKVHRPQPAITANGGQVWLAGLLRENGLLADRNERLWPQ
jgi:hypothetical protein